MTNDDYDAERTMAFKAIVEKYHNPRRRQKEMLKWYEQHPSPLTPQEQLHNLKRALSQ